MGSDGSLESIVQFGDESRLDVRVNIVLKHLG